MANVLFLYNLIFYVSIYAIIYYNFYYINDVWFGNLANTISKYISTVIICNDIKKMRKYVEISKKKYIERESCRLCFIIIWLFIYCN